MTQWNFKYLDRFNVLWCEKYTEFSLQRTIKIIRTNKTRLKSSPTRPVSAYRFVFTFRDGMEQQNIHSKKRIWWFEALQCCRGAPLPLPFSHPSSSSPPRSPFQMPHSPAAPSPRRMQSMPRPPAVGPATTCCRRGRGGSWGTREGRAGPVGSAGGRRWRSVSSTGPRTRGRKRPPGPRSSTSTTSPGSAPSGGSSASPASPATRSPTASPAPSPGTTPP